MLPDTKQKAAKPPSRTPPDHYQTRRDLHRSHLEILRTLWVMADGTREVQITNRELQQMTALGRRTVQLRTSELAASGWLEKKLVRRTERFNDANIYRLTRPIDDPRLVAAGKRRRVPAGGCNQRTELDKTNYIKTTNTSLDTPTEHKQCNQTGMQSPSQPAPCPTPTGKRVYRPARRPHLTDHQLRLLQSALAHLRHQPNSPITTDCPATEVLARIDRLREQHIPGYNDAYWNHMVKRHGYHAFCAVLETVAMIQQRIPRADGDDIRSPAGYLGGIFRKASIGLDMRPDITLATWVEIENNATKLAADRQAQHKAAARRHRNDEIRRCFLENARAVLPADTLAYLSQLRLIRQTADAVHLAAPTRFLKDHIQSHHHKQLCQLWSTTLGGSVFVKISVRPPVELPD